MCLRERWQEFCGQNPRRTRVLRIEQFGHEVGLIIIEIEGLCETLDGITAACTGLGEGGRRQREEHDEKCGESHEM
ncbi:MAG: hypothetical protein Rubg2KO_07330 [Rubricoccaceae bacterium]